MGSVIKKRRKRMSKKKHRKMLRKTRHQRKECGRLKALLPSFNRRFYMDDAPPQRGIIHYLYNRCVRGIRLYPDSA